MSKLHQVLAVESDLEGKYKRICEETIKTFSKAEMFRGSHRKLVSFAENAPDWPEENAELTTTVNERLEYTAGPVVSYFDALLQKEATNQNATADLVVNGITIGTALPATFLLGLESRLKYIRKVYEAIPTLAVGTKWEPAPDKGPNIFAMAYPEEKLKSELTFKSQILVEPTEHHPAQIEKWQEQMPVGKFVKNVWCGMITSNQKSILLQNIDDLLKGVKMARQKANSVEVQKLSIGADIMSFINTF